MINKTFYKTFIILFLVSGCQNKKKELEKYDQNVMNAMVLYIEEDYQASLQKFNDALELNVGDNTKVNDYFFAAAAALKLGDTSLAKETIISSIVNTDASKEYFLSFKEFDSFRSLTLFNEISDSYEDYRNEYFKKGNNPNLNKVMDSLLKEDQAIRNTKDSTINMREKDSLIILKLIDLTKKHGWQNKAWLLLWHQRDTFKEKNYVWNYFYPLINEEIEKGNIRKGFWSNFEDQNSIMEDGTQIFGTYMQQFDLFPLRDVTNIDKLRDSIGLPPLWYFNKVYGYPLPQGYKASK
ncbi:hypothetical protein OO010_12560 [Flavobacteriaceae bacterium KMM 6898]|nr:hypothetical protein [Flavobacteriaceae bacterium KMM 6898]